LIPILRAAEKRFTPLFSARYYRVPNPSLLLNYTLAAVLAGLPLPSSAQDANGAIETHKDIIYAQVGAHSLKLDLYIPKGVARPMPVVMWVHGGGWRMGNKDIPWIMPLVPLGFAVASIDYRLSQEAIWPAQIHDCKAAVRWLRKNGPDYGLDPNRIGAVGASAGGQLVALLGTTADHPELEGTEGSPGVSSAVQAVCDFFGPTNFTDLSRDYDVSQTNFVAELLGGPIVKKWAEAQSASPVFYVSSRACPFFIAHGDQDKIVPVEQSIEFADALKKAGVPTTLIIVKGGGHGFNDPPTFAAAFAFLQRVLQVKP
jgi:acetyl esterase/lipase